MLVLTVKLLIQNILCMHVHVIIPVLLNLRPLLAATTTANQAILAKVGKVDSFQTISYRMESSVCSHEGTCCTGTNTPPWFSVNLSSPTSDDIEVRIMGTESTDNEDTPIALLEIYVH